MKTAVLSMFFLCGTHAVCLAQLGIPETDEAAGSSGNTMEDILGKDFFDFRRPRTLRAAPTSPGRSAAAVSSYSVGNHWDYRFDAQYQSTIKPYLRWYMRNDPNRPGERYLPRYMTSQSQSYPTYGVSSGCSSCGTSSGCSTGGCSMSPGYSAPVYAAPGCVSCGSGVYGSQGYQPRSRYWQHLDYLQGQYGSTPARPRRRSSHLGGGTRTMASAKAGATKTVWVSRDSDTGLVSVLFVEPPAAQSHKFFKGKATLTSAMKLAGINWEKEPDWSGEMKLANTGATDRS